MPQGKDKSRTKRRVPRVVPGGRNVLHRKHRKPQAAHCTETGEVLKGVPRARPSEMSKLSKTQRRPERPFGGVLSSTAMRKRFVKKARSVQEEQ